MISLPKLERQVASGRYENMFDDALGRSRPLPLGVRLRLSEPEALAPAALGLALKRVCELTYRPTPASISLLDSLLECQQRDGRFGTLAATSVAVAGLLASIDQLDALPGEAAPRYIDRELESRLREGFRLGLDALATAQDAGLAADLFTSESGGQPVGALIGDEIDSAIAIWQLGLEPRFARAVRLHDLLQAVDARGLRHGRSTAQLVGRFDASGVHERALESAA